MGWALESDLPSLYLSVFCLFYYLCCIYVYINAAKMTEYGRNEKQKHYILLLRKDNRIVLRLTKTEICEVLGISVDTLRRRLDHHSSYHCDEYSVWCNVMLPLVKRGFYKHNKYRTH